MARHNHFKGCDAVPGVPEGLPALLITENLGRERAARIVAVGDTCFGGRVAQRQQSDLPPSLKRVGEALLQADLVFANVEGVFSDETVNDRHFTGPEELADAVVSAGIGVANLANNHTLDQGQAGLESTARALSRRGVHIVGAGPSTQVAASVVHTDVGDLKIGWLAAARTGHGPVSSGWWINELDSDEIVRRARKSRGEVDCLIASLHTGYMFVEYPDPGTRELAHRLSAEGVCLVLIHHPHVLQGVEVLENGSVVCYSLGNFLFDWRAGNIPTKADESLQRQGGLFCFELDHQGVISATLVPTVMSCDCDVLWPEPEQAAEILNRVTRLSEALVGTDWEQEFWHQRAERNTLHGIKTLWYLLRNGRMSELFRLLSRVRFHHLALLWTWIGQRARGSE